MSKDWTLDIGLYGRAVGVNVRKYRLHRKLSQRELGKLCKSRGRRLSATTISQIETGQRRVEVDDFVTLSAALRRPMIDFLDTSCLVEQ